MKKDKTEDEDKQSISSKEHLGYDNSNSKYSVLIYNANSIESHEGDSLLISLGSSD